MKENDDIKEFLSADPLELEKRYNKRMGIEKPETIEEAPAEGDDDIDVSVEAEETSALENQNNAVESAENADEDYYDDEFEDESRDYFITEEDTLKSKPLEVIDKFPRQDEEVFKLPKPKTMSQIEGNIEIEDKERGIVFTSFYNKKERYHFNRLYDVSGEKPVLLASGDIDYKGGMFIVNYPNKQPVADRGDYLKYMQSALYKLDKSNKPHFVAGNVVEILNDGWFEQSSGKDYSVYLCKDENAGKYRRIMNFGADMSGHREVMADGTIIDELDRTDWYHKDEYKYDAKKHTLRFVKGQGYESDAYDYDERHGYSDEDEDKYENIEIFPDLELKIHICKTNGYVDGMEVNIYDTRDEKSIDHSFQDNRCALKEGFDYIKENNVFIFNNYGRGETITIDSSRNEQGKLSVNKHPMDVNKRKEGFMYLGWKFEDSKYGTLFHPEGYVDTFVKGDGTVDRFLNHQRYHRFYVGQMLSNGLAYVNSYDCYDSVIERHRIYDFKISSYRDDLEEIRNLGHKFYAAKKTGEKKFGVYEMADEDMKNPLMMVDDCKLVTPSSYSGDTRDIGKNILFSTGDKKLRCEITPEGKLKPIAKQSSNKDLYLSTGGKWVKVDFKDDTRADIGEHYIGLTRGEYYTSDKGIEYSRKIYDRKYLSNDDAIKFAHSITKTAQTEKGDVLQEGYHNAKERVIAHLQERHPDMNAEEIKNEAKLRHSKRINKGRDLD